MTEYAFTATAKQQELFDTVFAGDRTIIGFGGGVRGTKTWGGLALLILLCRIYPGSRWCVVRKDLERIRKNTLPSYEKLRELTGGWMGPVNQSTWESRAANGSTILFFGENAEKDPDLSRWKGLEVNGFLLEEGDELTEAALWKAVERAGAWILPKGPQPLPWTVVTFNPNESWPARLFYEPWQTGTLEAPFAFIPATLADNPYAPESYKKNLKNLPTDHYARFVAADWAAVRGQFYEANRQTHLVPRETLPDPLPPWWEYWGSFDWGFRHWAVFGAWAKDPDGQVYLLDSCWVRGEQDDAIAETILGSMPFQCVSEVYAGHDCWAKEVARGGSGIATVDVFAEAGIGLVKADTDLVNGARSVRSALAVRNVGRDKQGRPIGRPGVYLLDTPGNVRVLSQLTTIKPDPKNLHKPLRMDADAHGNGGNDGADMFRYGLATRMDAPADRSALIEQAKARRAMDTLSRREDVEWEKMERELTKRGRVSR